MRWLRVTLPEKIYRSQSTNQEGVLSVRRTGATQTETSLLKQHAAGERVDLLDDWHTCIIGYVHVKQQVKLLDLFKFHFVFPKF